MATRIISFFAAAFLGAGSTVLAFYLDNSDIWWSIVSIVALVMGVLAFWLGKLFWEHFGDIMPW